MAECYRATHILGLSPLNPFGTFSGYHIDWRWRPLMTENGAYPRPCTCQLQPQARHLITSTMTFKAGGLSPPGMPPEERAVDYMYICNVYRFRHADFPSRAETEFTGTLCTSLTTLTLSAKTAACNLHQSTGDACGGLRYSYNFARTTSSSSSSSTIATSEHSERRDVHDGPGARLRMYTGTQVSMSPSGRDG